MFKALTFAMAVLLLPACATVSKDAILQEEIGFGIVQADSAAAPPSAAAQPGAQQRYNDMVEYCINEKTKAYGSHRTYESLSSVLEWITLGAGSVSAGATSYYAAMEPEKRSQGLIIAGAVSAGLTAGSAGLVKGFAAGSASAKNRAATINKELGDIANSLPSSPTDAQYNAATSNLEQACYVR